MNIAYSGLNLPKFFKSNVLQIKNSDLRCMQSLKFGLKSLRLEVPLACCPRPGAISTESVPTIFLERTSKELFCSSI